jgi:hypothetical protein
MRRRKRTNTLLAQLKFVIGIIDLSLQHSDRSLSNTEESVGLFQTDFASQASEPHDSSAPCTAFSVDRYKLAVETMYGILHLIHNFVDQYSREPK